MATITTYTKVGAHDTITIVSGAALLGDTVTLTDLPVQGNTHVFLGVILLNAGGAEIVDSAGTLTVSAKMVNTSEWETPQLNVIDATAPTTVNWSGNTRAIRVVPASLSDTVTYKVVATFNRS